MHTTYYIASRAFYQYVIVLLTLLLSSSSGTTTLLYWTYIRKTISCSMMLVSFCNMMNDMRWLYCHGDSKLSWRSVDIKSKDTAVSLSNLYRVHLFSQWLKLPNLLLQRQVFKTRKNQPKCVLATFLLPRVNVTNVNFFLLTCHVTHIQHTILTHSYSCWRCHSNFAWSSWYGQNGTIEQETQHLDLPLTPCQNVPRFKPAMVKSLSPTTVLLS